MNLQDLRYKCYITEIVVAKMVIDERGGKQSEALNEVYDKIQSGDYLIEVTLMQEAMDFARTEGELII